MPHAARLKPLDSGRQWKVSSGFTSPPLNEGVPSRTWSPSLPEGHESAQKTSCTQPKRSPACELRGSHRTSIRRICPPLCGARTAQCIQGLRELLHTVRGANKVEDVDPRRQRESGLASVGGLLESDEEGESAEKVVSVHPETVRTQAASRSVQRGGHPSRSTPTDSLVSKGNGHPTGKTRRRFMRGVLHPLRPTTTSR